MIFKDLLREGTGTGNVLDIKSDMNGILSLFLLLGNCKPLGKAKVSVLLARGVENALELEILSTIL